MKLSLIFELLMIFVLLAFAASKSVRKEKNNKKQIQNKNDEYIQDENSASKYCKCSDAYCNCCRDFALPVVNLDGPGCASLMYLENGKMSVSLSFGRKVITNKTLSSKKPSPICMPLPGGISKFCGRVYNIARTGEEFRACLGLELQNKQSVEAAVRVSCFKFGPRGVNTEPADPLPLVPQDEVEDEDDDDDDDDDYGLSDDEDDDGLGGINDVDTADYTGFSILGEDLLGDLFGSSDSKKPKDKNKNKKKQAPIQLPPSSTTTTRRPRPSRRPTRRPTRVTTPRTTATRTTTVKVRPGNRRPTRRPNRRPSTPRPNRNPTTPFAENSTPAVSTGIPIITIPVVSSVSPAVSNQQTTERAQYQSTANYDTYEPVVIVTQKPSSTIAVSTSKPVTNFEDPGIEMSLAHITGQLSSMPGSSIISNDAKDSSLPASEEQPNFEIIETITPKSTTVSYLTTLPEKVNEDMVQIVHNLDSSSEEDTSKKETMATDESRSHDFVFPQPKKKEGDGFDIEDMDVLDLSAIGETVGHEIGLFGKKKRQNRHNKDKDTKVHGEDNNSADYDVLGLEAIGETVGEQLGLFERNKRQNSNKETEHTENKDSNEYDALGLDALGESLGLKRSSKNIGKRDRRRQNKMMRGEWSHV